jgi:hypothetical protein
LLKSLNKNQTEYLHILVNVQLVQHMTEMFMAAAVRQRQIFIKTIATRQKFKLQGGPKVTHPTKN